MSSGLSPIMNELDLNMDIKNEEIWIKLSDCLETILQTSPNDDKDFWRKIVNEIRSKYEGRTHV